MINQKNDKRGGFYWHNGKPFVSVTKVLEIIDKPALRYWFAREVYWCIVNNPTMNEKEAMQAPWSKSSKAKSRGTTVHSIVESFKTTGDVVTPASPEFKGYARAFETWVHEYDASIVEHERSVFNQEHRYGGTLDMLAQIGNQTCIIDVKTGKDIYPEAGLQLSAYLHTDGMTAKRIGVLLLQPEGLYKFQWMPDNFDVFLHAKALWEWNNHDILAKVNYFAKE
jgi:hypothetical protein